MSDITIVFRETTAEDGAHPGTLCPHRNGPLLPLMSMTAGFRSVAITRIWATRDIDPAGVETTQNTWEQATG